MMKDKIVMGINDSRLQQKLLEIGDLTLDQAVKMCRAAKLSKEHSKLMMKYPDSSIAIDTIKNQ